MEKFAIATFCYSERYQNQVNRMISEIDTCDFKPTVVVVTDDVSKILNKPFVKVYDISDFNPEYKNYSNSYYEFDFSVKRYSLLAALNLGFNKIILSDADAVPNKSLFNEDYILRGFGSNSVQGQVTYNFSNEIMTNSELGKRFLEYEKYFGVTFDKNELNFMPEDCIQYIDIETSKFYNFLRVWDECISYKKKNNLKNTPAGNIDEMCFAALKCGLTVGNNSNKTMNALIPIHDKWYDSSFSKNINEQTQKTERKKVVVTSIYELNYIDERGSSTYKGFHLLTQTIRNLIFDGYEFIIYTDQKTFDKYNLLNVFPQKNVTIKTKELNSEFYLNYLNPIRKRRVVEGEIWDRIHSVENYIEVILNKIQFMIDESADNNSDIIWLDSGLFGTSCSNAWRDHMNVICHTENFLEKIFEKINTYKFIALRGDSILINYEIKNKINSEFNVDLKVVPACLFGGNSELVNKYFTDYKSVIYKLVDILNDYTSEQEVLYLLLHNKNVKFFDFFDWDDLQKGMLKIMDIYDETTYDKDFCGEKKHKQNNLKETRKKNKIDDPIIYPLTDRQILDRILSLDNYDLDRLDLTHNDIMLSKMSSFATLFHFKSGNEHYRLLSYISKFYDQEILIDIGTNNGCSAIALAQNSSNTVFTYDTVKFEETNHITLDNINFKIDNVFNQINSLLDYRFILMDANQDGILENKLYKKLKENNYKGLLLLDDINLNGEMKNFWNSVDNEKYEITDIGHNTGTGLIIFE